MSHTGAPPHSQNNRNNRRLYNSLFWHRSPEGQKTFVAKNAAVIRAVCEIGRGSLGPNAMHKLFSTGTITTDGLTLVREMKFRSSQPMVNYLLKALESHDGEVGDGTTRMLILIGALLEAADGLIKQGLLPIRIVEGFGEASSDAVAQIRRTSHSLGGMDGLTKVATTALSGKTADVLRPDFLGELTQGVSRIAKDSRALAAWREAISFEMLEASLHGQKAVFNGVLLHVQRGHPSAPTRVENAAVALIDYPVDVFNKPAYASRIPHGHVESVAQVGEYDEFSRRSKEELESLIAAIVASGAEAVICKRGLGNQAMSMLASHGIFPVEKITREADVRRLILATKARVVGNPIKLSSKDLGKAALIEEVATPSGHIVLIDGGSASRAITIIISGVGSEVREARRRGIETAVGAICAAISCRRVVAGGGAAEAAASRHLHKLSFSLGTKKQLVYQGFAGALMSIPRDLAETTGMQPFDLLSRLNHSTDSSLGIDATEKVVCNTYAKGIIDPLRVVSCYISNASDFASQMLGTDALLVKPPEREEAQGENRHRPSNPHNHSAISG